MKTRDVLPQGVFCREAAQVFCYCIAPSLRERAWMEGKKDMKRRKKFPGLPENPRFLLEGAALIGVIAYLFYDSPAAAVFSQDNSFVCYYFTVFWWDVASVFHITGS
jgi:hypothetical protein